MLIPKSVSREMAEQLKKGINQTKIIAPPTDCISPIGAELLEKSLRKEVNAEFYVSTTRPPTVYRGNPFTIEAALAYGGQQEKEGSINMLRFANRVPLLFQQSGCSFTKAVTATNWRPYGLSQSNNSIPQGPMTLVIHIASVWVPFTSESKEAIAHYPEIIKELKLALQECGRKLSMFIHKKKRIQMEGEKRSYIETYIPHVAEALKDLVGYTKEDEEKVKGLLAQILEHKRGKLEKIEIDNPDYDEELANMGANEDEEDFSEDKEDSSEKQIKKKPSQSKNPDKQAKLE